MRAVIAIAMFMASVPSFAQKQCIQIFDVSEISAKHRRIIAENAQTYSYPRALEAFEAFNTVYENSSFVRELFGEKGYLETFKTLNNFEKPLHQDLLAEWFTRLKEQGDRVTEESFLENIAESLVPFFTPHQITKRYEAFKENKKGLEHLLGEMKLSELQEHVYGDDVSAPSRDSLIGRFLEEVEAETGTKPTQEFRSFYRGPERTDLGESKNFVVLTQAMFPIYQRYFNNPHFLVHTHHPHQGTLMVGHNGKVYSYAGYNVNGEIQPRRNGSVWPILLLSSAEAQRTSLYFTLPTITGTSMASKHPWDFQGKDGKPYLSEKSAYTCCTHWIGDMPIGEKLVDRYIFPGKIDTYGQDSAFDPKYEGNNKPRKAKIGRYFSHTYFPSHMFKKRLKLVWKENRNHMALWEVFNIRESQEQAELTNPGYTLYAFVSKVTAERAPIVFVFDQNNRLPTNDEMADSINAY